MRGRVPQQFQRRSVVIFQGAEGIPAGVLFPPAPQGFGKFKGRLVPFKKIEYPPNGAGPFLKGQGKFRGKTREPLSAREEIYKVQARRGVQEAASPGGKGGIAGNPAAAGESTAGPVKAVLSPLDAPDFPCRGNPGKALHMIPHSA